MVPNGFIGIFFWSFFSLKFLSQMVDLMTKPPFPDWPVTSLYLTGTC